MSWYDNYRKTLFMKRLFLNEVENTEETEHLFKVENELNRENERKKNKEREFEDSCFIPSDCNSILDDPDNILPEIKKREERFEIEREEKIFENCIEELVQEELVPQKTKNTKKKGKKKNKGYYNQSRKRR